ncbi:MAG TPA: PTS system mannose/fructose/sorbose family transporter subunit IID [Gemmatimonadota bacterium]|nr:PTS system mannose/fructose/sorbose family transporter subunit IID [Gemmatimonadota bacterium]
MKGSAKPRARRRAAERRRIAGRATLLQAAWNYETLQAIGFAWALLPGLERLYPDPRERARRVLDRLEVFNSNPYLATIGLGVALRLEEEVARGAAGAERRQARLLKALCGSLGALGDRLFWAGWRPALGLAAAVLALATSSPWPAVAFVIAYNVLAQGVRWRGVRAGFAGGAGVARVLQDPFWARASAAAGTAGAVGAGAALGAGAVWAYGFGGGEVRAGIFLLLVALLWLAGLRIGSGDRRLSPVLAFWTVLILLSALFRLIPVLP